MNQEKLKVTICGAGPGGQAIAAHMAIEGCEVNLYNRTDQRIQPIKEKHVVQFACTNMFAGIQETLEESFPDLKFIILGKDLIRVESIAPVHVGPLVRFLETRDTEVSEARRMRPSLEEIFVNITGIETDAMRKEKEKKGGGQ